MEGPIIPSFGLQFQKFTLFPLFHKIVTLEKRIHHEMDSRDDVGGDDDDAYTNKNTAWTLIGIDWSRERATRVS
jgi:hypothetical protein